jgi:hypothetical protein
MESAPLWKTQGSERILSNGANHSFNKEDQAMARFLIEVPHDPEVVACARVVEVFLKTGSHFLTNADWGCKDGDHKALIIADVDSKDQARYIVPPAFRPGARVLQLNKFTMEEIDEILRYHNAQ